MTAAIYETRNLNVAFIEKGAPGGKMTEPICENYRFPSTTRRFGACHVSTNPKLKYPHTYGEVKSVENPEGFTVKTE